MWGFWTQWTFWMHFKSLILIMKILPNTSISAMNLIQPYLMYYPFKQVLTWLIVTENSFEQWVMTNCTYIANFSWMQYKLNWWNLDGQGCPSHKTVFDQKKQGEKVLLAGGNAVFPATFFLDKTGQPWHFWAVNSFNNWE